MEPTGFETEAYKLMISDIAKTQLAQDSESLEKPYFLYNYSLETLLGPQSKGRTSKKSSNNPPVELTLKVKLVWIQGHITANTYENGEKALSINDGSGAEGIVFGWEGVPGGNHPNLVPGTYVGVLGQILRPRPVVNIKAVKIMHLQDKPHLDSIWDEEVKDLKAFLIGLIKP